MIGKSPRGGLAGVSSRAGWTDQINFYQVNRFFLFLSLFLLFYQVILISTFYLYLFLAWKETSITNFRYFFSINYGR